jgi:hypothetical protein
MDFFQAVQLRAQQAVNAATELATSVGSDALGTAQVRSHRRSRNLPVTTSEGFLRLTATLASRQVVFDLTPVRVSKDQGFGILIITPHFAWVGMGIPTGQTWAGTIGRADISQHWCRALSLPCPQMPGVSPMMRSRGWRKFKVRRLCVPVHDCFSLSTFKVLFVPPMKASLSH